jgi:hypothetical protein
MYKTWTGSAPQAESLARDLEAHLNEFAGEVVSVAYAVSDAHYVLAVYKLVETSAAEGAEVAVTTAEQIIEGLQP